MTKLTRILDRSTYLAEIDIKLAELGERNHNVLVYYGEAELTYELSKSLHHSLRKQGQLCALVDGTGLRTKTKTPEVKGLALLRDSLGKGKIDFSCFDIAYWVYWSHLNPELAIDSVEFSKQMGRADKLSAFADLVGAGQELDLSGLFAQMEVAEMTETARALIPHMLNDIGKVAASSIGPVTILANLAWLFVGLNERRRIWWKERGNQDLRELKEECETPFDIIPRLPLFLARDLKHHFRRSDLSKAQQTAVIFVDSYDDLVDSPQSGRCSWLENMWEYSESSPYILWVVTARRPLSWIEEAQQRPVLPLTQAASEAALQTVGISDQSIRQAISQAAQGSPLQLDISFQYWQQMQKKRSPRPADFLQQLPEMLRLEGSSWEPDDYQLRQLLAIPRYWDEELLQELTTQFLGEAIDPEGLQQKVAVLIELPYVLPVGDGSWYWQAQMRDCLLTELPEAFRYSVHRWLFERYKEIASQSNYEIQGLEEALYHALNLPSNETEIAWFLSAVLQAIEKRPHPTLPKMLEQLVSASSVVPEQLALAYSQLGRAFIALYEWESAQSALETARECCQDLEQQHSLAAADTQYALAQVDLALDNSFDTLTAAQDAARIRADHLGKSTLLTPRH